MFKKRTRLYTHFELKNLYHVFKSLIFKKKNFSDILKKYLKVKNIHLTSQGRVSLYDIIKIIKRFKSCEGAYNSSYLQKNFYT